MNNFRLRFLSEMTHASPKEDAALTVSLQLPTCVTKDTPRCLAVEFTLCCAIGILTMTRNPVINFDERIL